MAPAPQVSAFVFGERSEATTGHHGTDALVKRRDKQAIVSAQRVSDHANGIAGYFGHALEHIHCAHVIHDAFHAGAGVSAGVHVDAVIAKTRIIGRKSNEAAFGEFGGVMQVFIPRKSGGLRFARLGGLVQAKHGRHGRLLALWDQEVGWNEVVRIHSEQDLAA